MNDDEKEIHTSAPAKLMLMGEHSVCYGGLGIVAAMNKRIHVHIKQRFDKQIIIHSALTTHRTSIEYFTPSPQLDIVCSIINDYRAKYKRGFEIRIDSEFSCQLGLGSSAAIIVATISALSHLLQQQHASSRNVSPQQLFQQAMRYANSSGADIAASLYGGVLAYRKNPTQITALSIEVPLTIIYSGSKQTTYDVVNSIKQQYKKEPITYQGYFKNINKISEQYLDALISENWQAVAECMTEQRCIMKKMQLENDAIEKIFHLLKQFPRHKGYKISGSGRGDCVIALGELSKDERQQLSLQLESIDGAKLIDLQTEKQGLIEHTEETIHH